MEILTMKKLLVLWAVTISFVSAMGITAIADENISESVVAEINDQLNNSIPNMNGYYIVEDESEFISGGVSNKGWHIEDGNGKKITQSYFRIGVLSGKLGLFQYSVPAGMTDSMQGVFKIEEGKEVCIIGERATTYRCVEAGDASFIFPVGSSNEYYDLNGNKIEELGLYLKKYNISLERDKWAEEAITCAWDWDFMPPNLGYNYRNNITRAEFCRLAVNAVNNSGIANIEVSKSPFSDVDDYYVSVAANLGIVSGMGNGKFEPERYITREEAAVLLCNIANLMGKANNVENVPKFADDNIFSDWSRSSIYKICGVKSHTNEGVMVGMGNNKFSPKSNYTREQAIVTIYRMLNV